MNSVAPSRRPSACSLARERRRAAADSRRAAVALHGRPRPVGRQLERRRRAAELLAASRRAAASSTSPRSHSRCQTAKSAYWTGSSGSGDGSPAGRPRRARRARARARRCDQPSETMWCMVTQQHVLLARPAAAAPTRSSGPAREVERAPRPPPATSASPPRAPPAGEAARGRSRGSGSASAGGDHLHRRAALASAKVVRSDLVAADDLVERARRAPRRRASPAQAQRGRHVVGGAPRLELVEEPEPLLRERERQRSASRGTRDAAAAPASLRRLPAPPRSAPARPATVGASNTPRSGSSTPKTLAHPRDQLRGEQRVAAELEEVVARRRRARRRARSAQIAGQQLLHRASAARADAPARRRGASGAGRAGGRPCRSASAAAPRGRRTPTAPCTPAGARCRKPRSSRGRERRRGRRRRRPAACRPARPRAPAPPPRARPGARASAASISPSSMRKPRTLTWWSIRPRNSSCPSGRQRARSPVRYSRAPGSVERIGHEALGRQLRPVQIAARQTRAAEVQLAGHADRHRLQAPVEHVGPRVVHGRPIGGARSVARSTSAPGRVGRVLRRAVEVADPLDVRPRVELAPPARAAAPRRPG